MKKVKYLILIMLQGNNKKSINFECTLIVVLIGYFYFFFYLVANVNHFVSIDSFYHIALSEEVLKTYHTQWLPLSVYGNVFPGKHYLFQVILKPFTHVHKYYGPILYQILVNIILALTYYIYLKKSNVSSALLWTFLLIFGSQIYLYRTLQIRPITITLILLIIYIKIMYSRKTFYCFIVSLILSMTYSAYLILFVILCIYFFIEKCYKYRNKIKILISTVIGIFLGNVLNPSFPNKLLVEVQVLLRLFKNNQAFLSPSEWAAINQIEFFYNFWPIMIVLITILMYHTYYDISYKMHFTSYNLFLYCNLFVFTILIFYHIRFVDYWYLFMMLLVPIMFESTRRHILIKNKLFYAICYGFLICIISCSVIYNTNRVISVKNDHIIPINRLKSGAEWIQTNSKKSELVVLGNIDSFPELLYHNKDNQYSIGMDWRFIVGYNKELAMQHKNLIIGEIDKPSRFLKSINSKYLFIDNNYIKRELVINSMKDKHLDLSYVDKNCLIFRIKNNGES